MSAIDQYNRCDKSMKNKFKVWFHFTLFVGSIIFTVGCKKQDPLPIDAFKAEISTLNAPAAIKAKSEAFIKVKVKNASRYFWSASTSKDSVNSIFIAYHWLDNRGNMLVKSGRVTSLPADLETGQEVVFDAKILAPDTPGQYILEFDMLQHCVSWFGDKGSKTTLLNIQIN